jgi:hypothetical protein
MAMVGGPPSLGGTVTGVGPFAASSGGFEVLGAYNAANVLILSYA